MNLKRILYIAFLILMFSFDFYKIYGAEGSITDQGKDWLSTGEKNSPLEKESVALEQAFSFLLSGNDNVSDNNFVQIAGILQGLGIFVIAIVGVILGIRLVLASPENKAKLKEALIIYLVGSVIIISALGIWKLMISILDVV